MTEKRFWCLDGYEGETSVIVDGKFTPTNGWLCNKLNELNNENQYLKSLKWNQDCINEISISMQQRQLLEKENEQLKKENKELQDTIETICKDFEEKHGMDIRNADWFTAW